MTTYRAVSVDDVCHWFVCNHKHRTITGATECMFRIGYVGSYILAVEKGCTRKLNEREKAIFERVKKEINSREE